MREEGDAAPTAGSVEVALPGPLTEARFVERPNRFVVRARLPDGQVADAHLADPGRLKELLLPDATLWLRPAENPARVTRWSAVLVGRPDGQGVVSVDTTLPNRLVLSALRADALDELAGWTLVRSEWAHEGSRFDFLLEETVGASAGAVRDRPRPRRLVLEVKSVTLVEDGTALFPDAVTARGARHVRELAAIAGREGWEAAVLFVLQRPDADRIVAARSIDPDFADALEEARAAGVRVLGRRCMVERERVVLGGRVAAGVA